MTPRADAATAAARERALLDAARAVFRRKGYEGATVAEIVRAAGVAQGTFYLYFGSKKEAFFALGAQLFELMAGHVERGIDPSRPLEERVRAMTGACFAAARENDDLVRLVFFGAESASVELQEHFAQANPVVAALRAMIEREIEAGRIAPVDAELTARLLMGLVKSAILEAFVLGDSEQSERLEETTAQLFARALAGGAPTPHT